MIKSLMRITVAVVGGFFAVLLAYGLFADGEASAAKGLTDGPLSIDVPADASDEEIEHVLQVLSQFRDDCTALFTTHLERVESAEAGLWEAMPYRAEEYGRDQELRLHVSIADDGGIAAGHSVEFYIWDDGWLVQKPHGAELCGQEGHSDRDTYFEFVES